MYFPWDKWEEVPVKYRPTVQIFVTDRCNHSCPDCFARYAMAERIDMSVERFKQELDRAGNKGAKQVNLLGGEPTLHPDINEILDYAVGKMKTTLYTNGAGLSKVDVTGVTVRLSIRNVDEISKIKVREPDRYLDITDYTYMVSKHTTLNEVLAVAKVVEARGEKTFFISSIRELDNPDREFFADTDNTMPVIEYKGLVHEFLREYDGQMRIHVSKRGVFESTLRGGKNRCLFANVLSDGRIVRCPYDIVNMKIEDDYCFGDRYCKQNSTCLMDKVVYRRRG